MLFLVTAALAFDPSSPAAQAVVELEPLKTRAGFYRLGGADLEHPDAPEALAWRLEHVDEPFEHKQAVARALGVCGDGEVLLSALALTEEPELRGPMLGGLASIEGADALAVLVAELDAPEVELRAEAARVLGYRDDGGPALVGALDDEAPEVRAMAARGIGWSGYAPGFEPLVPLLDDSSPEVVKHADRSLDRLDAKRAAELR